MSANDNLGPHLLGRKKPEHDDRDYSLEEILSSGDDLDAALKALNASHAAAATKVFAKAAVAHIRALEAVVNPSPAPAPSPTPTPTPTPTPSGAVVWGDPDQLDQGQTPHCVGFGSAQFCNADPINDHYTNADGDAIYYEAKVIDGEPKAEDGSSVHSGVKALANRGRVKTYAWATTLAAIQTWVTTQGPVIIGADWYNDMFNPNAAGLVTPTGGVAGGHCFIVIGFDPSTNLLEFQNSWGASWGVNGRFFMKSSDFNTLVKADGFEACAATELPLS